MRAASVAILWCVALAACRSMAHAESPAVLIEPSDAARAELQRVIAAALHVPTVTLADDALTREPTLLIDRAIARDARGLRLNGRDLGAPERFQLFKAGGRCELEHAATARRYVLQAASCEQLSATR